MVFERDNSRKPEPVSCDARAYARAYAYVGARILGPQYIGDSRLGQAERLVEDSRCV